MSFFRVKNYFFLFIPKVAYHSIENQILYISSKFHVFRTIRSRKKAKKQNLVKKMKFSKFQFFVCFFTIVFERIGQNSPNFFCICKIQLSIEWYAYQYCKSKKSQRTLEIQTCRYICWPKIRTKQDNLKIFFDSYS